MQSALAFGLSIIISSLVLGLLSSVGVLVLQGVLAIPTARAAVNQKTSFRLMFALAKGRIGALAGLGLLYLALIALALVVIIAGSFFLADQLGVSWVWIIVLIILALTAVSIWIGIKLMLAPAVIIMERAPLFHSLARSWQLTNRSWWRTSRHHPAVHHHRHGDYIGDQHADFVHPWTGRPTAGRSDVGRSMLSTMGPLTLASMPAVVDLLGHRRRVQAELIGLVYIDLESGARGSTWRSLARATRPPAARKPAASGTRLPKRAGLRAAPGSHRATGATTARHSGQPLAALLNRIRRRRATAGPRAWPRRNTRDATPARKRRKSALQGNLSIWFDRADLPAERLQPQSGHVDLVLGRLRFRSGAAVLAGQAGGANARRWAGRKFSPAAAPLTADEQSAGNSRDAAARKTRDRSPRRAVPRRWCGRWKSA